MTHAQHSTDTAPRTRATGTTLLRSASIALYVFLGFDIVVAALAFSDETDRHSLYERARSKPWTITLGEIRSAQDRVDLVNAIAIAASIATVVAFALWTWAAYSRLATLRYERRYSTAWAVAAWFVPFVNFVVPKRVVTDLVDVDEERNGVTTTTVSLHRWAIAWWGAWILALLVGVVSNSMQKNAKTIDDALGASNAFMVRCAFLVIAAVLGICMVCFVTRRQRELPPA
jgi:hypothetical protein